jgi:hypothetical protein
MTCGPIGVDAVTFQLPDAFMESSHLSTQGRNIGTACWPFFGDSSERSMVLAAARPIINANRGERESVRKQPPPGQLSGSATSGESSRCAVCD